MDFNGDGRMDVIVFSTLGGRGLTNGYSEIQFLRNDGGGTFVDVTDSVLVGYTHERSITYNPVVLDVNNDGKVDAADVKAAVQNVVEGVKATADVNKDGKVDVKDAVQAVQNTVAAAKKTADVNQDGKVDAADAKTVAKKATTAAKKAAGTARKAVTRKTTAKKTTAKR